MRIDIDYIINILNLISENNHPDVRIDIPGMKELWDDHKHSQEKLKKFIFHMEILKDQSLIESSIGKPGIGFTRLSGGLFSIGIMPLRLTADGHQFASDLSKPGVVDTLISSFKDAAPSEKIKIVFALGKKIIDKKLEDILIE